MASLPPLPEEARAWCAGRSPALRGVLLAYLGYAGTRHALDRDYRDLFAGLDLGVHELGHVVFTGLGAFLAALGGTFWELLVPAIGVVMFLRQRDFFAAAVAGCWLSFALFDVGRYVADARAMALPLVGTAPEPRHDWNFLLSQLGLLPLDTALGAALCVAAFLLWAASLLFGARLLLEMRRAPVPA